MNVETKTTSRPRAARHTTRLCVSMLCVLAFSHGTTSAATFNVTRFDDPTPNGCQVGDCSLREAVIDSNNSFGVPDTINLPAGTYRLTIPGAGLDDFDPAISDLDLRSDGVVITGAGSATTIIDATAINHRIFDIPVDLLTIGSASISGVTLTGGNTIAINRGGSALNISSRFATSVSLTDVVITGNTAPAGGAAVSTRADLNITDCTISNNIGTGIFMTNDDALIFRNTKDLTIWGSTIANNSFAGVAVVNADDVTITNSTISGNGQAGVQVQFNANGNSTDLLNVTIAGNGRAGIAGVGFFVGPPSTFVGPTINVRNTIVTDNLPTDILTLVTDDNAVLPNSLGNNLIGDNSGAGVFTQPTDLNNTDPLLDALALNAPGTTQTHAIPCDSPAFDAANTAFAPATDQRGIGRPQGAAADIGAYELDASADADGDGVPDGCDVCPGFNDALDADGDGTPDGCDTCTDVDGDNFGNGDNGNTGCGGGTADDCDDTNPAINPGANEICNGDDDNCDGNTDEGFVSDESCFLSGSCAIDNVGSSCDAGVETPCSTGTPTTEICDGQDNDCDGDTDEGFVSDQSCFLLGQCAADNVGSSCDGGVETPCTTGTPTTEICDGQDNDCDGDTDEDLASDESCFLPGMCADNVGSSCDGGVVIPCSTESLDCDDGNACTDDTCDGVSGCANAPVECDDGDACTDDSCDLSLGCVNDSVNCDDGNACTDDTCDGVSGCVNAEVDCDDGDECTADSCSPSFGCVFEPIEGCDEGDDGEETEPPPTGGGPPPIILTDAGTADDQGSFAAVAVAGNGELRAEVMISGAAPGTEFELVLTEGTPTDDGLLPGGTITGFAANGARLPRTLRIETNNFGGFFTAIVAMYFTDEELAAEGISRGDATDIELHTIPLFGGQSWTPAGNNVGNRMPPEGEDALMAALGQSGFFFDDENGRWCFWAVVDHFSIFAVGAAEVAQVAELPDDEEVDDVVVVPDTPTDDGGETPPVDGPPVTDASPADDDDDGIANVRDRCPGTEPGTQVDTFGCPFEQPPTQTEPTQEIECGNGVAPCGMISMLGLWGMIGGLGLLKLARPRVRRR